MNREERENDVLEQLLRESLASDAEPAGDFTARLMEQVHEALAAEFKKDPVAILTGVYTGAGERNWVFYTMSLHIFSKKFNEALADFEMLPLEFYADNDPDWLEYKELRETEIPDEE